MNTTRNNRNGLFRLFAATIVSVFSIIQTASAQSHNSSQIVQNILTVCNRLKSRRWVYKWHLSYFPPKELSALRKFAFRSIPADLLLENESFYVVELQPNPISYYRGQLLYVFFPSSGKIFEFREYDPETRIAVVPASPEQSVLELIEQVNSCQLIPSPLISEIINTSLSRYYNVLVLRRIGEHFVPKAYEHTGVLFDPLPPDIQKLLEKL